MANENDGNTLDTSTDEIATDDVELQVASEPGYYQPQTLPSGLTLPIEWECWRDGLYKRRPPYRTNPGDEAPPAPSIYEDIPSYHRFRVDKITGRAAYVDSIGCRADDSREMICLKYFHSFLSDAEFAELSEEMQAKLRAGGRSPGGHWAEAWVTYDQIADTRKLLELATQAFPVTSNNSRFLSQYLCDSYDQAIMLYRQKTVVRRAGHHEVLGQHGWLLGDRWIGPSKNKIVPYPEKDKLSQALKSHGSLSEWIAFTREHFERDPTYSWILRFFLGCSFAAPILRFIDQRTFFVHHYSHSGNGKSTILYLCQSIWGHPKEFSMALNRGTQNALTEIFKYVSDLPVALDELQGKEANLSDFIMQACTEEHKARVRQDGGLSKNDAQPWRTLIRTTGEQTMAGSDKADLGGQLNRVLEVRHPGLGGDHATEIWNWLEHPKHFGVAGPKFLERLSTVVNDTAKRHQLKERFETFRKDIAEALDLKANTAVVRHLASIAVGEYLMLFWIYDYDREEAYKTAFADVFNVGQCHLRARDAAGPLWARGLDLLMQHRHAHANQYADASSELGKQALAQRGSRSSSPIVAAINAGTAGDEIWFIPSAINAYLQEQFGSPPSRFWEDLAEEGVLNRDKDRLIRQRQITGVFSAKVYVVRAPLFYSKANGEFKPVEPIEMPAANKWYGFEDDDVRVNDPEEEAFELSRDLE